jgi:hypothetical protein
MIIFDERLHCSVRYSTLLTIQIGWLYLHDPKLDSLINYLCFGTYLLQMKKEILHTTIYDPMWYVGDNVLTT